MSITHEAYEYFQLEPMEIPNCKGEHFEVNNDEEVLFVYVMSCILSTPIDCDVWKCTSIFYNYIPFKDKACKLVIDGGNTMNVVFESAIARFDLKLKPHPRPFRVAWVDKISLPVKERCLVPLKLRPYLGDIYHDVLHMDVIQI